MIVDALIFLTLLIVGPVYALAWILTTAVKLVILIFKPLWFIFFFLFSLVKNLVNPNMTVAPVWTPDDKAVTFIHSFPAANEILILIVLALMIGTTIKAFKHDK